MFKRVVKWHHPKFKYNLIKVPMLIDFDFLGFCYCCRFKIKYHMNLYKKQVSDFLTYTHIHHRNV